MQHRTQEGRKEQEEWEERKERAARKEEQEGRKEEQEETAGAQVSTNPPFPLPSPAHKKGASQHSPRAPFVRRSICH